MENEKNKDINDINDLIKIIGKAILNSLDFEGSKKVDTSKEVNIEIINKLQSFADPTALLGNNQAMKALAQYVCSYKGIDTIASGLERKSDDSLISKAFEFIAKDLGNRNDSIVPLYDQIPASKYADAFIKAAESVRDEQSTEATLKQKMEEIVDDFSGLKSSSEEELKEQETTYEQVYHANAGAKPNENNKIHEKSNKNRAQYTSKISFSETHKVAAVFYGGFQDSQSEMSNDEKENEKQYHKKGASKEYISESGYDSEYEKLTDTQRNLNAQISEAILESKKDLSDIKRCLEPISEQYKNMSENIQLLRDSETAFSKQSNTLTATIAEFKDKINNTNIVINFICNILKNIPVIGYATYQDPFFGLKIAESALDDIKNKIKDLGSVKTLQKEREPIQNKRNALEILCNNKINEIAAKEAQLVEMNPQIAAFQATGIVPSERKFVEVSLSEPINLLPRGKILGITSGKYEFLKPSEALELKSILKTKK